MFRFSKNFYLLIALLTLFLSACHQRKAATPISENLSSYIYAYTSGVISKSSPVLIRFIDPVVQEDQVGENVENGILYFSPSIAGQAVWENTQTIRFTPKELLPSSKDYLATVKVKSLFPDAPKDAATFSFEFRTKDQYFTVDIDGLQSLNTSDLSQQILKGKIQTTDLADDELVEKLLVAKQDGKTLPIDWTHSGQTDHLFIVNDVVRGQEESKILLNWNGSPLKVDIKEERTVIVPSLSDFKVTDVFLSSDQSPYLGLHFSDPLEETQNLNGLISVSNYQGSYRYLIEGQKVRVYLNSKIIGEQKILVSPGIRNINNVRMKNGSEWTIQFQDAKPQLRLVGKGVILPNSEGLIFPFEAIGLNAVEIEVLKIFNNNILQFLQVNEIDGNYDLKRVGRIILQKKLSLLDLNPDARTNNWSRYAIDLNELFQQDPDAIYQIRIGFRPSYSTYFCKNKEEEEESLTVVDSYRNENEEIQSIMDGWYGIEGYYNDYRWEHRENPCFPAYYNSERFIKRNVMVSNLGITVKGGKDDSYFVSVNDLRTTAPIANVPIEFYDYQQQLIQTGNTNGSGITEIQLKKKPFVVVARNGNDRGYLRLQDGSALSLSRFDVAGAKTQKGLKGFLYGDRGVWRPGDSIFLNFILEDKENKLPENYPISFEFYDPRGQLQEKRVTSENVNNIYPLFCETQTDAPTGSWRVKVLVGGATFERSLMVETVKPNRLKIDLDFGKKQLSRRDEPLHANLQVDWLHGAPAQNLKTNVEAQLVSTNTTFPRFKDFEFDDPARKWNMEPKTIFDGQTNSQGVASFSSTLFSDNKVPGKLIAKFKTRAFEKSGNFSTDNFSLPYHPYNSYVGINIPENKYGSKRIDINKSGNIQFVALDKDGNPTTNRRLELGLYRVEWRWWWERGEDYVSRYNSSDHIDALEKTSLTTNSNGETNWEVSVSNWGRYMVRVCDPETGHCSGDFFYAGYPWNDGEQVDRSSASVLNFVSDKKQYNIGEMVSLTIPGGEAGRALITYENGTKVLQSQWIETQAGENQFTFKVLPEMAPTVYVHVSLIQPHAQVKNDLPIRLYGVIPINVEDPNTRLEPTLAMPEELQPEQTVTIEVAEANKKPMAYTIAMVDEGLLSLTRFQTPDPWKKFYAREALGVHTWDLYDKVLGAYGGELERVLSIGGDGEVTPEDVDQKANRFKPVVKHLGPFYLKKGEKATHQITLPNYVGAVRTMVVAADKGAYGSVEKSTPVRKPLMVLATLPRVLGPGEQIKLPVSVFSMAAKVKNVNISVKESSGLAKPAGVSSQTVRFDAMGEKLATFDFDIQDRIGVAKFLIEASGNGEKASQEIEIQVRNPNPFISEVLDKAIDPGQEWQQAFAPVGMLGTNEAVLEVSHLPPINLAKQLHYLIQYPYGCLEQTLSGGFPQLYVDKLLELNDQQKKEVPLNIQATVDRLKQFQNSQGGFSYWPGHSNAHNWSTSYAGHFLLEAKVIGYSIPPGMIENWVKYQKKLARNWRPSQNRDYYPYYRRSHQLQQAYRLYTLALARQPDLSAMNRLRESGNLALQSKWQLAAAYALAGKPEVGKSIIESANMSIEPYRELSYTFGSDLRDMGIILQSLTVLGERDKAGQMIRDISDRLSSNRWYSTQSISYALLAIGKYVGASDISENLAFSYQIGNGNTLNAGSNVPIVQINIPIDGKAEQSIKIKNPSQSVLFARLIRNGQPVTGMETSASNDLKMEIAYKDLTGDKIDPTNLSQGTDFIAEVTVTNPGSRKINYEEMALNQIFPSGWEILNTRMDNVSNTSSISPFDYQDFRDDRVHTFFDVNYRKSRVYKVQLNAAYQGRFYLPSVSCEAMYDESINARSSGQWVEVIGPKSI